MINPRDRLRVPTQSARPRVVVKAALLLVLLTELGACGLSLPRVALPSQVYLHSSDTQKATQQAKDDFGKIQVDQYFSDQQKGFTAFISQEDTAVTAYLVALRNRDFANLLRTDPLSRNEETPRSTLDSLINARLDHITGSHTYTDKELQLLRNGPRAVQNHNSNLALTTFVTDMRQKYLDSRPPGDLRQTDCALIPDSSIPNILECSQLPQPKSANDYYQQLVCECGRLSMTDKTSNYNATVALLGRSRKGDWTDVNKQITDSNQRIADESKKAKEIQCIISELKHTPDKTCPADLAQSPEAVHQNLQNIITSLQNALAETKTTPAPPSSASASPTSGAAATPKANVSPSASPTSAVGGTARLSAAKGIAGILEDILSAQLSSAAPKASAPESTSSPAPGGTNAANASTSPSSSSSPAATASPSINQDAEAALKAVGALANQKSGSSVNSVLVALAAQQQEMDMAQLQIDYSKKLVTVLAAERAALISEVSGLAEAKLNLKNVPNSRSDGLAGLIESGPPANKSAIGATLSAYNTSWIQGQIPFKVMQFKEIQLQRQYAVDVAAKTAANWNKLLQPAFDELVAYGQDGIQPATVAQLLFASGIIAAVAVK